MIALRSLSTVAAIALAVALAAPRTSAQTSQLVAWPPSLQLDDARDHQRIVVLDVDAEGVVVDVTATAQFAAGGDAPLVEFGRDGDVVRAVPLHTADGEATVRVGDRELRLPVAVRGTAEPPVSFRNDVMPIFMRSGCNAGTCHGAAVGKNGFALSLFGYDPSRDHVALTRELRGRRLDFAEPTHSLLLQKATAQAAHKGGKRFAPDSTAHDCLRRWIETGAADDGDAAPKLVGIDVLPDAAVLVGQDRKLPLLVRARYADGSDRDVTHLALWSSGNEGTAKVDREGLVTTGQRGEAVVLARYGAFAAASRLLVHADAAPFTWPADVVATGAVDRHVHDKLRRARTLPAGVADDATFVRRLHLDLLGTLPTVDETRAFLADPSPDKRTRLVDELIARPGFAAAQAMAWAEVLQVDEATLEKKGAALLSRWLRDAFAKGRPFDEVVRELIAAEGSTFENAPTNFQRVANQPHLVAEKVSQVFLGVRVQCAQCHNHPFERWTMDDYYGFAAFFARATKKRGRDPYENIVYERSGGDVNNLRTGQVAPPRFLGGGLADVKSGESRRAVLAAWLTAKDNPFFARNVVNRLWARFFGRGLVDPVDDVRVGNPPSHPALLDELAALFVSSGFDVRPVVRAICTSRTYQSALARADVPAALFAGQQPRRLSAEALLDAIGAATAVPTKYPGVPLGEPATMLDNGRAGVRFLEDFGRPQRESACTCERSDAPTLGQVLHLVNGDTIAAKIAADGGRLARALKAKTEPAALLDELFLAACSRVPTAAEKERLLAFVAGGDDVRERWQDVFWSVLNSKEFLFQH